VVRILGNPIVLLIAAALIGVGAYSYEHWRQQTQQETAVGEFARQVFRSPSSFVAGNKEGDVSVVIFSDYNCPDCKKGAPDIVRLISNDPKVRVVLKELPVLGPDSESVARLALAAKKQGKYLEFHDALFREPGRMTRNRALRIAKGVGLNRAKLEKDSEDKSVTRTLSENKRLARRLGIKGVPFYLVGDHVIPSDSPDLYVALTEGVADIRKNGCRTGPCS
jgi:protein-disulfide isomerase